MNKVSGGDRIPVELFQILKDDAVKVLHSIWQQIGKTPQWSQDWKRSVFIPIPKKVKSLSRVWLFMDCSLPGFSVHGIFQARVLEWVAISFSRIPKKGNAKECSNYCTTALISHASKVMLKILQARLQQYMNCELLDVQAGFRKGRGTRDQTANIHWIIEKARVPEKYLLLLYWLCQSLWLCGSQ